MKNKICIFAAICFFLSCNEEPIPIPDFEIGNTSRVVLIEDLTGVQCPNCPKGAATIESMLNIFEEKLAVVAIHGRLQAEPLPESAYDFRTQFATDLEEYHRPFIGKPSALINRKFFENEFFTAVDLVDLWPGYVEQELQISPKVTILHLLNYDGDNRQISLDVSLISNENILRDSKISIFITENEIIDIQETRGSIIEDFEHNHVLRSMLTKFDGDDIKAIDNTNPTKLNYTYSIPSEFNPEHMEVIVAIADGSVEKGQILQAAKIKVVE